MNIANKISISILIIVLTLLLSLLLAQPLTGYRGAPWLNYYLFELPLLWLIATVIVACILSQTAAEAVGTFLGDWIRGGGFWATWSKNNIPGNTWAVIALLLVYNALTYGLPTPQVDWGQIQYDAKMSVEKTLQQPAVQETVSGLRNTVNYLAKGFIGQKVMTADSTTATPSELLPRYQKGWWRIWSVLIVLLLTPIIWVWGRRNDLADKVASLVDFFRGKRETKGSATTDGGKGSLSSALLSKIVRQTDKGEQVFSHLIGEFLARGAETLFGGVAKLMKRY